MEQRPATSVAWQRSEPWLKNAGSLALWIGIVVGFHWIVSPTESEQAAARQWALQRQREEFDDDERYYAAKCSNYPSSDCSALINVDDDSEPCFIGQVKANRRSGIYHTPGSRWYGRTTADVLCFKTAALAEQAGYRAARGAER